MLILVDIELVVEVVAPDLLHIVPVSNDAVFDHTLHVEYIGLDVSLITDIDGIQAFTGDLLHELRVAAKRREGVPWVPRIREAILSHTGPVVDNHSLDFVKDCKSEVDVGDMVLSVLRCNTHSQFHDKKSSRFSSEVKQII